MDNLSPIQNILSGFGGVVLPRAILAPYDTMKLISINHNGVIFPTLKKKLISEGIPSLWNGCICSFIQIPPQFIFRYLLNNKISKYYPRLPKWFVSNTSTLASIAAFYPLDVVYSLMQYDQTKYPTIPKTLSKLLKEDGITGLYKGLQPTILGFFPFQSTKLLTYYMMEKLSLSRRFNFLNSYAGSLVTASVAMTTAQAITYPFDVVRKRMICDPSFRKKRFHNVFKEIYHERGIVGFYDSFNLSLIKVVSGVWLQQTLTYEFKKIFEKFNYVMKYQT